jgi:hypothetical protein
LGVEGEHRRDNGLTFADKPEQRRSDSLLADWADDVRVQNYYTLGARNNINTEEMMSRLVFEALGC